MFHIGGEYYTQGLDYFKRAKALIKKNKAHINGAAEGTKLAEAAGAVEGESEDLTETPVSLMLGVCTAQGTS